MIAGNAISLVWGLLRLTPIMYISPYRENMKYYVHVYGVSTAATDDLSRDDPGSTVSGTSSATKSTRLISSTVPKATRASVKKGTVNTNFHGHNIL